MSLLIRWKNPPKRHVRFQDCVNLLLNWYMSRWINRDNISSHATLICVRIKIPRCEKFLKAMQSLLNNWKNEAQILVRCETFTALLGIDIVGNEQSKFCVVHTHPKSGDSLYTHIVNMEALVCAEGWDIVQDTVRMDNWNLLKMSYKHEPHSHTILIPGTEYRTMRVQCKEPQRICDLLKKNDLISSNVWNSKVALSTECMCSTLLDHEMTTIYANEAHPNEVFFDEEQRDLLPHWQNMKYIKVQIKSGHQSSWAEQEEMYSHPEMGAVHVPHVIYYSSNCHNKLSTVINQDLRFARGVQCVTVQCNAQKRDIEDVNVSDIDPNSKVYVVNSQEPTQEEAETPAHPYACFVCGVPSDTCMPCGHLCCFECLLKSTNEGVECCGICRKRFTFETLFGIQYQDADVTCNYCGKVKRWLVSCEHLLCLCTCPTRCDKCNQSVIIFVRMFLNV